VARAPGAPVTISVALCTYNGARYLDEQLASIEAQDRLPDEVVVCDDASQDTTRLLLEAFARRAAFPVRLYFNEVNLGYTGNFEQAIRLCTGDTIVLCDQDDVWHADKLRCLEATLDRHPEAGLVFTDADIIDGESQPLDYRLWQCADFSEGRLRLFAEGRAVEALLTQNAVTGATMAFRSSFRDLVLPIPAGGPIIHDWWIALLVGAVSKIIPLDQPLISYRRHEAQHMGFRTDRARVFPPEHYEAFMLQLDEMARRLRSVSDGGNPQVMRALAKIEDKAKHLRARLRLPSSKWLRAPGVLAELLSRRYHRYSNGWRSAARDLLL
jgi:hypothetical protein